MRIRTIKSLTRDNTARNMFFFGLFFFVVSNIYFGWNATAQSGAERICDLIWHIFIYGGGFIWLVESIVRDMFFKRIDIEFEIEGYKKEVKNK